MLWSSSPTRKIRFAGAASRRASRSWLRSTSWTSSTSRCAQRERQLAEQRRVALERPERARDEVVEVDRAGRRRAPARRRRRRARRARARGRGRPPSAVTPRSSLSREKASSRRRRAAGSASGSDLAQDAVARHEARRAAGVAQDLEPKGVEGPDADGVGSDAERLERGRHPLAQLLGGAGVERDRRDRRRVGPRRHEPGDARHEGRRLAAARRRDAQDGARAARWPRRAGPGRAGRAARRRRRAGQGRGAGPGPRPECRRGAFTATHPAWCARAPPNFGQAALRGRRRARSGRLAVASRHRDSLAFGGTSACGPLERERAGCVPARSLTSEVPPVRRSRPVLLLTLVALLASLVAVPRGRGAGRARDVHDPAHQRLPRPAGGAPLPHEQQPGHGARRHGRQRCPHRSGRRQRPAGGRRRRDAGHPALQPATRASRPSTSSTRWATMWPPSATTSSTGARRS